MNVVIFMVKSESRIHMDPNIKHFMAEVDLFVVGDRHMTLVSICEDT